MNLYFDLFITFAKMGVCTFGGGLAMLPILQREVVEKKKWATDEELTDYYAIGQCTPGVIAVNTATFIGYKEKGALGGIIATMGMIFPSLIIITVIAAFLSNFAHPRLCRHPCLRLRADLQRHHEAVENHGDQSAHRHSLCLCLSSLHPGGTVSRPVGDSCRSGGTGSAPCKGVAGIMLYLRLFLEYFYAGLFSVGGGLATIPFLQDMGARTGWFTSQELANMIAISEATPGPMGVNMATYVGFTTGGPFGSIIATLGLVAPSIIVIILVSVLLHRFRDNRYVDSFFYGLRPASTALIGAACWSVVLITFWNSTTWSESHNLLQAIHWKCVPVAVLLVFFTNWKKTKPLHPILWIALAAVAGIVFQL